MERLLTFPHVAVLIMLVIIASLYDKINKKKPAFSSEKPSFLSSMLCFTGPFCIILIDSKEEVSLCLWVKEKCLQIK